MSAARHSPQRNSVSAARHQAAMAALGATAVAISWWPLPLGTEMAISLVPALVMVAVLVAGWRATSWACLAVLGAAALLPAPPVWQLAFLLAAGLAAGEALRRGAPPGLLVAALLLMGLLAHWPIALRQPDAWTVTIPATLMQACLAVAVATVALALLPRRRGRMPARCRIRWDHLTFLMTAGIAAAAAIALLAAMPIQGAALRMGALLATAVVVDQWLAWWCRRISRRLPEGAQHMPREVARRLAGLRRTAGRVQRNAHRADRQLQSVHAVARQLDIALKAAQRLLAERTQAQQESALICELARARARALMARLPGGSLFVDAEGIILSVSTQAATLLGIQPADLVGKPLHSLIPADHVALHPLDLAAREDPDRAAGPLEGPVQGAGGRELRLSISVELFVVRGVRHGLVLLEPPGRATRDQASAELQLSADAATRSRDLFIASMSHELRTPLHGLIATLDMMRGGDSSTDEFRRQLTIARSSARTLLKIADDVLDLARIKSNLFKLEHRPFSMTTILHEVVDEHAAQATSMGLTLTTEVGDRLPLSFRGDPARVKQIIGNLVSNALKFTGRGGVAVRLAYDGARCTVDVRDTGTGIPVDKRDRIFEPFVQLDVVARGRAGGTGLGLPISRQLAQAMRGDLVLQKSGPEGSVFRLTLPLEASDEVPPDEQSQRILRFPRGRILVVEDNAANRYVAEALLAGLGCPATIVEGGAEALQVLHEQEFDLILMDCQMPGMDGYETTRQARLLLPPGVPIIAMTANAMAEDRSRCLDAGMDDFLSKPFDRHALNATLCRWLAAEAGGDPLGSASRAGMHPDLDTDVLDELRASLQWRNELLERIRSSFVASVEEAVTLLATPAAPRDALLRQLHTLTGSAGMVGARQVEYLVRQIQVAVKENRPGALDEAAEVLGRALRRYEREFARRLEDEADPDVMSGAAG